MTIELDEERPITPSLKLRNIGDEVIVAIADKQEVPWMEFGTDRQKVGKDGKARTQERFVVIVIGGTAVYVEDERDEVARPGMEASIYLAGHSRWERIQAYKRDVGGRGVRVGDVMRWRYDRDERSTVAGLNDKKVRTISVRDAKADESAQVAACEALYHRLHTTNLEPGNDATTDSYGDEEPF